MTLSPRWLTALVVGVVLGLSVGVWVHATRPDTAARIGIAEAQSRWGSGAVDDYELTYQRWGDWGGLRSPATVWVLDGVAERCEIEDPATASVSEPENTCLTVEDLFAEVQQYAVREDRGEGRLSVTFHGTLGYPTSANFESTYHDGSSGLVFAAVQPAD